MPTESELQTEKEQNEFCEEIVSLAQKEEKLDSKKIEAKQLAEEYEKIANSENVKSLDE